MSTIVFVTSEEADAVALGLFDLSKLGNAVVLTTSAENVSQFIRENNLDESSTLFLHVGLCNSPGGLLHGVVVASSAVSDNDDHATANANFCRFMAGALAEDRSWVVLPIDAALQSGVAETVNRMWLERDQDEKTKPAPDVMRWTAKTGFFKDPANPALDEQLCDEVQKAIACFGEYSYYSDPSTNHQVTTGRLKSVQRPALEKKTPYGIAGFDATTCLFYMMLGGLGFRYFVAIKAVQSRERIKTIEDRCLSISAAIFVAKKWIKERQPVVQNTRTVILSGNEVGNVLGAAAAGVRVTQNTGTIHLSGNAIGNVIGEVHGHTPVRLKKSVL